MYQILHLENQMFTRTLRIVCNRDRYRTTFYVTKVMLVCVACMDVSFATASFRPLALAGASGYARRHARPDHCLQVLSTALEPRSCRSGLESIFLVECLVTLSLSLVIDGCSNHSHSRDGGVSSTLLKLDTIHSSYSSTRTTVYGTFRTLKAAFRHARDVLHDAS